MRWDCRILNYHLVNTQSTYRLKLIEKGSYIDHGDNKIYLGLKKNLVDTSTLTKLLKRYF